jgi:hypothetical protein
MTTGTGRRPLLAKRAERVRQLERRHLGGAERDREVARQRRAEAEARQIVDQVLNADAFGELDRDDVARLGQRRAQRRRTEELLLVVLR